MNLKMFPRNYNFANEIHKFEWYDKIQIEIDLYTILNNLYDKFDTNLHKNCIKFEKFEKI